MTFAYALRDAALPHLVAYTARSSSLVGVARALTAFVSVEAARALAEYLETKPALPVLRAYFREHRALAEEVLTPLTTSKKKKIRETAAALLAP